MDSVEKIRFSIIRFYNRMCFVWWEWSKLFGQPFTSTLNHEVRGSIPTHGNGANSLASRLPLRESTRGEWIIHCCRRWTPRFTPKKIIRFYNMIFKVQKMEDTPNKRLPIDMQVMILLRLPVKSLVRFKCVSKNWLAEITSQSFIDLYNREKYPQNHDSNHQYLILVGSGSISSFDYSSNGCGIVSNFALPLEFHKKLNSKIVGSCNGLLCFVNLRSRKISVYNPITRANRVKRLPAFPDAYTEYVTGFGYDHKTNDYKILWVSWEKPSYIFRLKSNTCEEIKFTPTTPLLHFGSYRQTYLSMVYSNNALHWETPGHKIISCFDIGSEQFYELGMPHFVITTHMSWNIADLKGYLHFVTHCCPIPKRSSPPSLVIWVMKEYGVSNSWTKLTSYSSFDHIFSCGTKCAWSQPDVYIYSKDDQEILIKLGRYPKDLFSCNLITRKIEKVRVSIFDGVNLFDSTRPKGFYVAPWSPSFVSL